MAYPRVRRDDFRPTRLRQLVRERRHLLAALRWSGTGSLLLLGAAAVLLVASAPLTALLTGELVERVRRGTGLGEVLPAVAVLAGALLLRQLVESLQLVLNEWVGRRIDGVVRSRVRRIALAPTGIEHLEDPRFADEVLRASDQGNGWRVRSVGKAAVGQLVLTVRLVSTGGMAAVLAVHFPLLAAVLVGSSLLMRAIIRRQWMYLTEVQDSSVAGQRRLACWSDLASGVEAAKEVRLFGLADWIGERRLAAHHDWLAGYWTARRTVLRRQYGTMGLAAVSGVLALAVPGWAALSGQISLGTLTACLVAEWGVFAITVTGPEAFDIEYGRAGVRALHRLTDRYPPAAVETVAVPAGDRPPLVRFDHVTFRYPGSREPVLDGLDLTVRPGEVLAVVGVSGAGKTTLTKLLAGLYRPTAGRVTVDGADLAGLDAAGWRRRLAVLFQDFVHYPGTVRDNIALAAPEVAATDEEILDVVRRVDLGDLVSGLRDGLATGMWRAGTGGRDLSGGQWQKVAIARVLFAVRHGRRIVVLDEPTAHLDVRAEASFHDSVVAAANGASVVLISHRLSTVRAATRIVVLSQGRITESGTHEQLLAADGEYARLFRLQAARFAREAVR